MGGETIYYFWVMKEILVSICIITYNQAKYISEALDSILSQETDFEYEILINDDASTDETQEILKDYQLRFPERVFPILQTENQRSKIMGAVQYRFNLSRARGKYIAICDGDDYWTDTRKLQKQVDLLEEREDIAMCFHPVELYNEEKGVLEKNYLSKAPMGLSNIEDLAQGNYIHSPSAFMRNVFGQFPESLLRSPIADYVNYMYVATHGLIYQLPEAMAVYRVHGNGIWSTKWKGQAIVEYLKILIEFFNENESIRSILVTRLNRLEKLQKRPKWILNLLRIYNLTKTKLRNS